MPATKSKQATEAPQPAQAFDAAHIRDKWEFESAQRLAAAWHLLDRAIEQAAGDFTAPADLDDVADLDRRFTREFNAYDVRPEDTSEELAIYRRHGRLQNQRLRTPTRQQLADLRDRYQLALTELDAAQQQANEPHATRGTHIDAADKLDAAQREVDNLRNRIMAGEQQ